MAKLMRDLQAYSTHNTGGGGADLCPGACGSIGDEVTRGGLVAPNLKTCANR